MPAARIGALLFVSGAGGLVLEVAWFRRLAQVAGATSIALAAVLTAVLGGMALGAFLVGRIADRAPSAYRLYARLEFGVALAAVLSPWLLDAAGPLFAGLHRALAESPAMLVAARFGLSVALLAPLSLCLGGSLPAAAASVRVGPESVGRDLGRLYALNTLGAVAGTLLAGFLFLPSFGLNGTMRLAAILSGGAGAGALLLARRARSVPPPPPSFRMAHPQARRAIRLYALSGFLALSAEVAFTRGLVLVFGSATYAFTTVLAVFLAGIGAGAALGTRLAQKGDDAYRRLELCVALTAAAFSLCAMLVVFLPRAYLRGLLLLGPGFEAGLAIRFGLASLALLPGCLGLGVAFPLAARLAGQGSSGHGVGMLYAGNTLASVVGATAATFALVPWLGPLATASGVGALVALSCLVEGRRWVLLPPFALAAIGLVPPPQVARERLYAGVYTTPEGYLAGDRIDEEAWADGVDVPYVEFGRESTVTLHRWYGPLSLLIDGKAEASEQSAPDLQHLALLGHVPMCVHEAPRRVLVVGFGLGKTWEAVSLYEPEALRVVEIEQAVVHAAATTGVRPVNVMLVDARTFLAATDERFDVITCDPIHPWVRGSGDLYTREYFLAVRSRLAPQGVACQWLPLYQMGLADVRAVVRTFASVFVTDAYFAGSDLILVGSESRVPPRPRAAPQKALPQLEALGAVDLASLRVADHDALRRAAGEGPWLADDALTLEFTTPRHVTSPEFADCLAWVRKLWGKPPPPYDSLLAAQEAWARGATDAWTAAADEALRVAPGNGFARRYVGEIYLRAVPSRVPSRDFAGARKFLEGARKLLGDDPRLAGTEADLAAAEGDRARAAGLYRALLEKQPGNAYLKRRLARVE